MIGVYSIRIGEVVYVGASADIGARWKNHQYILGKGLHTCKELQTAFNNAKDSNSMVFEVLEEVIKLEQLVLLEKKWHKEIATCGKRIQYGLPIKIKNQLASTEKPCGRLKWRLKTLLEEHDLTAYKLAHESGIAVASLYTLLRGEGAKNVARGTLAKLISALRRLTGKPISVCDLLEFTDE
jgi:DNA-binding Xre family transcriptional regulator